MYRTPHTFLLLTFILSALPFIQQAPPAKSKVVPVLSDGEIRAITEPREKAAAEMGPVFAQIQPPDLCKPLSDSQNLIAIVTVTNVMTSGDGGSPFSRVDMRIDQMLRGVAREQIIHAQSLWSPPHPVEQPIATSDGLPHGKIRISFSSGRPRTIFDDTEPKIGNRYILGYSRIDSAGGMFVNGAVNLDDVKQAQLVPEVQRFLSIEAAASGDNVAPFVDTLNDPVRWIRDLSAQRLAQSVKCNVAPSCQEALVSATSYLVHSGYLGDRWEAVTWLQWISEPIGNRMSGPNGLPPMSGVAFRELLVAAVSDTNLVIGDKAFGELELFDFYHATGPGDCIEYVPALRKSARWTAEEAKDVMIGGHNLGSGFACNPQ
jgi:hypothetical protein